MTIRAYDEETASCPDWCRTQHGDQPGEDDNVHISGTSYVAHTMLRLCATIDPDTGVQDGPYIMIESEEFTVDEAVVLIAALTGLVEVAAPVTPSG